jgi:hypothetical protein
MYHFNKGKITMGKREMDVVIVPSNNDQMDRAMWFLNSAGIEFNVGSVTKRGEETPQSLLFTKMTARQRILMKETIGIPFQLCYAFG